MRLQKIIPGKLHYLTGERDGPRRVHEVDTVNGVLSAFLLTFAGLFPIVNPIEAAPFFLGLTAGLSTAERALLARKAAVNGFRRDRLIDSRSLDLLQQRPVGPKQS